jgi:mitochondrial intermembrane space import and assembly protein 40
MQDCFRKYPEIYGAELQDDEQDGENAGPDNQQQPGPVEGVPEGVAASESQSKSADVTAAHSRPAPAEANPTAKSDATAKNSAPAPAEAPQDDVVQAEASHFGAIAEQEAVEAINDNHVPKAAFDATGANKN